jgi:hypothetical protein
MNALSVYMEPPGRVKVNLRANLPHLSVIVCEIAGQEASIRLRSGDAAVRHDSSITESGAVRRSICRMQKETTHPGQPTPRPDRDVTGLPAAWPTAAGDYGPTENAALRGKSRDDDPTCTPWSIASTSQALDPAL